MKAWPQTRSLVLVSRSIVISKPINQELSIIKSNIEMTRDKKTIFDTARQQSLPKIIIRRLKFLYFTL